MRAVSQWTSFATCHASIVAHEARHSPERYDLVALTRPDTVWYAGLRPHCLHDVRETTIVHRGPVRWNSTLEWLLLMPRTHAASILTTASIFDDCRPGQQCCRVSRSEDLLAFALGRAGRWRHEPFGVDILRGAQHARMRNAGCMQPETLGFANFERCRQVVYGLPAGAVAPAAAKGKAPTPAGARQQLPRPPPPRPRTTRHPDPHHHQHHGHRGDVRG